MIPCGQESWPRRIVGSPIRTVIESPKFQALRAEHVDVRMFDEIMVGAFWVLARDPARFAVPEPNGLGVFTTNKFQGQPSFWIVFTYDDERVRLHWIEPTEADSQ